MSDNKGWIGVDLDGTLAHYDGWKGIEHIGAPVALMVQRVQEELSKGNEGYEIRIFTARIACHPEERNDVVRHIDSWCIKHLGRHFEVTNVKDMSMISFWDDRAVEIVLNTGMVAHQVAYENGLREGAANASDDTADQFFKDVATIYANHYPERQTNATVDSMLTEIQIALDKFGAHNPAKYGFGKGRMP